MKNLTAAEITEVRAPSTKHPKEAYAAVVTAFAKQKKVKGIGELETEFPGVKPQHVAFMLKNVIKDDDTLSVVIHTTHGVTLLKN